MHLLQRLGIPFRTELLILTLLGMANSSLDWKPFDLALRLEMVRKMQLPLDTETRSRFTSSVKKRTQLSSPNNNKPPDVNSTPEHFAPSVLTATVILEFLCSLLSPFAHLLKLYPIARMRGSDVLLPWLAIHALNTLLPKLLSFGLVFVFYSESVISSLSLLEFLVVESVNVAFAGYHWYVFFNFYLDLRALERRRIWCREVATKSSCSLPQTYSSSPNVSMNGSSHSCDKFKELRVVRSLISFVNHDGRVVELDENSSSSAEEQLSPADKFVKILKLSQKELADARKRRKSQESEPSSDDSNETFYSLTFVDGEDNFSSDAKKSREVFKFTDDVKKHVGKTLVAPQRNEGKCPCSSSEDEEDEPVTGEKKFQNISAYKNEDTQIGTSRSNAKIQLKVHSKKKAKKINHNSQIIKKLEKSSGETLVLSPSVSRTLNYKKDNSCKKNDNLNFLLDKNFQLLDRMCKAIDIKNHNTSKNSSQKWLIFRHKLESTLVGNLFSKEFHTSTSQLESDHQHLKDTTQIENSLVRLSSSSKTKIVESEKNIIEKSTEKRKNYLKSEYITDINKVLFEKTRPEALSEAGVSNFIDLNAFPSINQSYQQKCIQSHHVFTEYSSRNPLLDHSKHRQSNVSVFKYLKNFNRPASSENQKTNELRNLQAYNNLTLEQDRREMSQKKKKSKMMSYHKRQPAKDGEKVTFDQLQDKPNPSLHPSKQIEEIISVPASKINREASENPNNPTSGCNPNSDEFELKIIKPVASSWSSISSELPIPGVKKSSSMREAIEQIDWSDNSRREEDPGSIRPCTGEHPRRVPEARERRSITDDETVGLLRAAFSFSDEGAHTFRLGPDASEPYPLFQAVALTIAEVFKSTGWRDFDRAMPPEPEEVEIPWTQGLGDYTATSGTVPREASGDEVERRKRTSAGLLEQLQELLDSSRETLSAIENSRFASVGGCGFKAPAGCKDEALCDDTLEYLTAVKHLCNQEEKIRGDIRALNAYVCTIEEMASSSREGVPGDGADQNNAREHKSNAGSISQAGHTSNLDKAEVVDNSGNSTRRKLVESEAREEPRLGSNRVCETKFENKVRVHHLKEGDGLSSGNVMEFDSEGHVLSLTKSYNPSFTVRPCAGNAKSLSNTNEAVKDFAETSEDKSIEKESCGSLGENVARDDSDENLIQLFNSFYKKIAGQLEPDDVNLQKKLEKLATEQNFSKFMSLFQNRDLKSSFLNAEVELCNSDLQNSPSNRKLCDVEKAQVDQEINEKNIETLPFQEEELLANDKIFVKDKNTERKTKIKPHTQELLENHLRYLESNAIKESIANWNRDSAESLDIFGVDHNKKNTKKEISFSDGSDMEEFAAD